MREAVARRSVRSAHDVSDGGLACCVAESARAGRGRAPSSTSSPLLHRAEVDAEAALFGEGPGRHRGLGPARGADGAQPPSGRSRLPGAGPGGRRRASGSRPALLGSTCRSRKPAAFHSGFRTRSLVQHGESAPCCRAARNGAPIRAEPELDLRDGPRDECGVFGVYAPEHDVARLAYFALFALQHRGQESAGIATCESGHITTQRDLGLVSQVFDERSLQALTGEMAIGHVRYSTTGAQRLGERRSPSTATTAARSRSRTTAT